MISLSTCFGFHQIYLLMKNQIFNEICKIFKTYPKKVNHLNLKASSTYVISQRAINAINDRSERLPILHQKPHLCARKRDKLTMNPLLITATIDQCPIHMKNYMLQSLIDNQMKCNST